MISPQLLNVLLLSQSKTTTIDYHLNGITLVGWLTVLVLVVGIWLLWQAGGLSGGQRAGLLVIRSCLFGLLVLMMFGWTRQEHLTQRPDLLLLIDQSASMQFEDQYDQGQLHSFLEGTQEQSEWSFARWELLNAWLSNAHFDADQHEWITGPENSVHPLARLSRDYQVSVYYIAAGLRSSVIGERGSTKIMTADDFQQQESRLGEGLRDAINHHRGRPVAAVILLTDGINTNGMTLSGASELAARKSIPLLIGGIGSERQAADIALQNPQGPTVAYLGEQLYLEVDLTLLGDLSGDQQPTEVQILASVGENTDPFLQLNQTVSPEQQTKRIRIPFLPDTTGEVQVNVVAAKAAHEKDIDNNRIDFRIQVYDDPTKVLVIEDQPRFEYRALVDLLSRSAGSQQIGRRFEVRSVLFSADAQVSEIDETILSALPATREALYAYDVIVVGAVGSHLLNDRFQQMLVDFVVQRGGGVVFIAGDHSLPTAFAGQPLDMLFPVAAEQFQETENQHDAASIMLTSLGRRFAHLQIAAEVENNRDVWEALAGPYWVVSSNLNRPGVHVLATTVSGGQDPKPLITQQFIGAGKVIFHWFDSTWRWDVAADGERPYDHYWEQTMRYLSRASLAGNDELIELTVEGETFRAGDSVSISVRFLDERRAPDDDHGVVLVIDHEHGRRRLLRLARRGAARGRFTGTLSGLELGDYRVHLAEPVPEISTTANEPVTAQFSVVAPLGESFRREMDVVELQQIADKSNGQYFAVSELDDLVLGVPPGRQVRVRSKTPRPIWNSNWVIAMVICLLSAEWCLRRRWYN